MLLVSFREVLLLSGTVAALFLQLPLQGLDLQPLYLLLPFSGPLQQLGDELGRLRLCGLESRRHAGGLLSLDFVVAPVVVVEGRVHTGVCRALWPQQIHPQSFLLWPHLVLLLIVVISQSVQCHQPNAPNASSCWSIQPNPTRRHRCQWNPHIPIHMECHPCVALATFTHCKKNTFFLG